MRGQAVVEWMVILAMALVILALMLSFNQENYSFFKNNVQVGQVKSTLNNLKNSVDFVYSQGKDAQTRLHVTIPHSSNFTINTLSSGRGQIQAVVYVNGNEEYYDVYTDANLTGSLPSRAGSYCIDVNYTGTYVSISRSSGSC
ncbi:MAG: hypothetical protein V1744_07610 [Candidatus Altiarchaeota archaeon]